MGGKYKLKTKIVPLFIKGYENMTYVEPFVGGGSIFFKKEESVKEIINDIDKNLIDIYKGFKKYNFERIKKDVDGNYDKEDFENIKNSKPTTDYGKFIRLFKLFRLSFYSQLKAFGSKTKINLVVNYSERLKNTIILNESYEKVIKKFDSPDTFIYLDPPYEGSNEQHYKHSFIDYEKLKDILDNLKGKFLMSLNDSPYIRKLFSKYNISTIKTKYTDALKGGQSIDKIELIIKNY
jgi:DNA adenine methylase